MPSIAKSPLPRLGILLSGRGSNFVALARGVASGLVPAEIALVVSNVAEAAGLERARELGLPAVAIAQRAGSARAVHESEVVAALEAARVDWICLAGYMRLLSPEFVARFAPRVVNIHPSLLPSFPGLHAQRQAIAAGVKVSGCTVHLVDAGLDSGPIVVQRAVPVFDTDDEASLAARILEEEHRAYADAMRKLLCERWRIVGRTVVFSGAAEGDSPGRAQGG